MRLKVKVEDWDSFVDEFKDRYVWHSGNELDAYQPFSYGDTIIVNDDGEEGRLRWEDMRPSYRDYGNYVPTHKLTPIIMHTTPSRFCDNCGLYINDNSLYCRMCGTKLKENWYDKN